VQPMQVVRVKTAVGKVDGVVGQGWERMPPDRSARLALDCDDRPGRPYSGDDKRIDDQGVGLRGCWGPDGELDGPKLPMPDGQARNVVGVVSGR